MSTVTPKSLTQRATEHVARSVVSSRRRGRLNLRELLKPHIGSLLLGLLAVVGEGLANLLQPWPLKIVLDDVLRSRASHGATINWVHRVVGTSDLAMLKFAC